MPPEHVQRIVDALMTGRPFRWLTSVMERCRARYQAIAAERERLLRAGASIDDLPSDIEMLRRLEQRDRTNRGKGRPQPERPQVPELSDAEIAEAAAKYALRHDCSFDVALPEVQRRYARARAVVAPAKPAPRPQRRPAATPVKLPDAVLTERAIEYASRERREGRDITFDEARVEVERFAREEPQVASLWVGNHEIRERIAAIEAIESRGRERQRELDRQRSEGHRRDVQRVTRYALEHGVSFERAADACRVKLGPTQVAD